MKAYKHRMIQEFNEVNYRAKKLEKMIREYKLDKINFKPTCPYRLLVKQLDAMEEYLDCLKDRAILEGIDLEY